MFRSFAVFRVPFDWSSSLCSILVLSLSFLCPHSSAEDKPGPGARPKVGLVLGGGGAKGAAHIGVIKVLEELRIPADYVAGTSMGAIVGALYASGLSAAELEKTLTSIDWDDMFTDSPPRKDIEFRKKREDLQILSKLEIGYGDGKFQVQKGLIQGQKVNVLFETMMMHVADVTDFDRLPIPHAGRGRGPRDGGRDGRDRRRQPCRRGEGEHVRAGHLSACGHQGPAISSTEALLRNLHRRHRRWRHGRRGDHRH
ncbi:MAG: patatin-like phospholipase family protein [Desulfobacterales bacterium]|nr:patatin-like phospholipase family protein [Desulfobacterales bacterium]